MSMSVTIYIAHYRTVPLMRSVQLNTAETDASSVRDQRLGDVEVWIAQVIAQRVPDCRTNHGKSRRTVRGMTRRWQLAEPKWLRRLKKSWTFLRIF